jgi:hypothetical protein
MSSITGFRIVFTGGSEEEQQSIIDAVMLILIEHGVKVTGMKDWRGEEPS